ncbi:MAG: sigma-54 factor interaction domain-containing protein, partial [Terriglobales bacterium]
MSTGVVPSFDRSLTPVPPDAIMFGTTRVMEAVRERVYKIASANLPVLIQGESGTGKDIIARMIHARSPWNGGPWVNVNCPAIPGTLLESELFGYEKGAFTGAYGSKPGRVEMANRGTLFLDEISELDYALQSKLLQLLQDGQFCRIGAQADKRVEVRVVCATN